MLNATSITPFRAPLSPAYITAAFMIPFMIFLIWHNLKPFGFVDESYIPMVYAQNIADGYGIVFSPGGEKVEGFESPLWVFILTAVSLFNLPLPFIAHWLSMFSAAVTIILILAVYTYAFSRHDTPTFWNLYFFPCMAAVFTVMDVSFIAWSAAGLETISYTMLLTALCYGCISQQHPRMMSVLFLIFILLRPEGIFFLPIILFRFLFLPAKIKSPVKTLFFTVILPLFILLILRYSYFGHWLPNTFYAALDISYSESFYNGIDYFTAFLQPRLILFAAVIGIFVERDHCRGKSRWIQVLIVLHCFIVIIEGGDYSTLHRLMVPILPLLSIVTVRAIQRLASQFIMQRITRSSGIQVLLAQTLLSIIITGAVAFHAVQLYSSRQKDSPENISHVQHHLNLVDITNEYKDIGKWLHVHNPPDTVIAMFYPGTIAFFSRLHCIDIHGINDAHISHQSAKVRSWKMALSLKSDAVYVLNQKPEQIFLFPEWQITPLPQNAQELTYSFKSPAQLELYNHPRFKEEYHFVSQYSPFGFISFYARK